MISSIESLNALQQNMLDLRQGNLDPQGFCTQARGQTALLQTLPSPDRAALHDLLSRLESCAHLSQVHCSFGQCALLDNVQTWIDRVRMQLDCTQDAE